MHNVQTLISLFNETFEKDFKVRLVRGDDEPIYLPAGKSDGSLKAQPYAQVVFAHGYFASGLHEIAHWCLAGEKRRQQVDYGYWYCPDGRSSEQQALFQSVEIKPQAIEWALAAAAGFVFRVSCDNLSGDENGIQPDHLAFERQVQHQLESYLEDGFPVRAQQFIETLITAYEQPKVTLKQCLSVLNKKAHPISTSNHLTASRELNDSAA